MHVMFLLFFEGGDVKWFGT